METRSRKRAEASSAAPSTPSSSSSSSSSCPSKCLRFVPPPLPSVTTRSRAASASASAAPMDSSSSDPAPTRRRARSRPHPHGSSSGKGKEREPLEPSSRAPGAERILDLSFDGGAGVDDDDSEGAIGILHQNLTSASSALQALLRKLGAGLDDLLPSSAILGSSSSQQSGRLKKILSGLKADGEEGKQVEALTQLCDMLSIGTEDSLGSFSVDSFVPVLVGLLNYESNPDIMLLAARALTHLCDVLPSSCAAVVHHGAVPCFCARLLTIEYMDLAEQSLQALKKISQEHPTACLRAGALMAVLSYLDFFSTGVQRVALYTAANMCKKLPSDAADFVMEAVPLLTNLLHYHDSKVLEHASVCLTRIAEAFASSPEKLDELCNHGLVAQAAGLISVCSAGGGQASLSTSVYTGLIRLLSTCASGSPLGAKTLLLLGISGTLKDILSGSGLVANIFVPPGVTRPPEQIYEIVNLADELLPPLPQGTISFPICSNVLVKGSAFKRSASGTSSKSELVGGKSNEDLAREKLLHDHPELLQQFGMDLLPVLIQIYGSSINGPVRHKCLSVIGKLMYFSTANMIESLLTATNISSFLAGVLAWKDPHVLVPALQIAEILMDKLPKTLPKMFVREGVVHAVDLLVGAELANPVPSQASPRERDNDSNSIMETSSRSRRSCRVSGNRNTENSLMDETKAAVNGSMGALSTAEVQSSSSSLRGTVSARARIFKDKYFPAGGSAEVGVTEDLLRLKNLCAELNTNVEDIKAKAKGKSKASGGCSFDISVNDEEHFTGVVLEMLSDLCKGDQVSTFEFVGSGVVVALLNYFTCGTFANEKISKADLPELRDRALQRYKSFIATALPANVGDASEAPMTVLVKKLQNALSSVELFPVVLSHSSRSTSGSARLSSGLSALSQPFKLRLCREQSDKSLLDYSSNIVLIDPLATLAMIEEFLWPRIQRSKVEQKPSALPGNSDPGTVTDGVISSPTLTFTPASGHRPTRSRSSLIISGTAQKDPHEGKVNSSKGKGKAVLKSNNDEPKGPQTRNSARRKAGLVKDMKAKPVKGESGSEDEELDVSPTEMDDAIVIEEDDLSEDEDIDHEEIIRDASLPVCIHEKVHDVKLGDAADDATVLSSASDNQPQPSSGSRNKPAAVRGTNYEFRSGSGYGTRSAMSFAAAAMAGLASASGRGIRVGQGRRGIPLGANANNYNKLIFTAGGKQLGKCLTIYQAFQSQLMLDEDDDDRYNSSDLMSSDGGRLWGDIFTLTYQRADTHVDASAAGGSDSLSFRSSKPASAFISTDGNDNQKEMPLLDSILQGELPCDLEKSNPTYDILALLRVLEGLNHLAPRLRVQAIYDDFAEGKVSTLHDLYRTGGKVPQDDFVNYKLAPKLARQLQDALALCSGSLPPWCYQMTKACPFLFPFETRKLYFNSTAFGLSRALHRLQQQGTDNHSTNEREFRVGRLQRQKVRVSRNCILDSAVKVMEIYSSQKAVLEVEYFGEVGTGLGPTLEFYTLLSHELQRGGLGMWRSNGSLDNSAMQIDGAELKDIKRDFDGKIPGSDKVIGSNDHIQVPLGLFPCPWPPNADVSGGSQFSKVIEYFRLLGRTMAKALQDGRLLDLPLSVALYKLVLGQELDLHDILSFDPAFGKILEEMQMLIRRKQYLEAMPGNNQKPIADLRFRGAVIEALCLDFTLPGYPDYVLKKQDTVVNIYNLEEYIQLVVDGTTRTGIVRQLEALRAGFNQVFDISSLQIFSPQELDYLLCGQRELWEPETLVDHVKFDHGYNAKSPAILNLLEIMGEFSAEQQHAFCRFVTGAPRLPPGGLAALNPKLTIVRKHASTVSNATLNGSGPLESVDDDLPSVMTCANYLKLPPYSTKEIMSKKLLYAISEGQGSFDLS